MVTQYRVTCQLMQHVGAGHWVSCAQDMVRLGKVSCRVHSVYDVVHSYSRINTTETTKLTLLPL